MKKLSSQISKVSSRSEKKDLQNAQKALLNILEDYSEEKNHANDNQRALLNILDDYSSEKKSMENTQRALLNILEDYGEEKQNSENIQKAVLNILEDYSDEKIKVEAANDDLSSLNKELDSFTYSISHDLRAPLRAINGYAQILKEDYSSELDEEGERILETIRNNASRMGTLIDELLEFSKLGRRDLQKKEIDMNELTKAVLMDMNNSVSHNAEIKINQLHKIKADFGLLQQVMSNLISNALKYSSKKEHPVVEIYSEVKNEDVVISVKDNGAGFDMRYYDKLFGVFQRLHKPSEFEGVGVGLAIIQRIITKHNGKVWAVGKVGEGAIFSFSLKI